MYNNNDHQNGRLAPTMSPRISFSNDFVESHHHENRTNTSSSRSEFSSSSSDFEFSVSNYNMMAADELFSKGRLLPYKANCGNSNNNQFQPKMTLREELLHDEEEDRIVVSSRPPKGPSRWKELLGLKRNNNIVKKSSDGVFGKKSMVSHEDQEAHVSKSSQETFADDEDNEGQCG
ncbi:membrane-associated kinase regulator-like protein [Thalictrum thalictroides]|uniref:Membrane-associated kinase regulator-like protein n=1 Tax=Thalictrum thalictroides TaxID=46969 RepID=A0A7J6XFS1_THATH|nr:membrane-associated kinase regulator-like protein [Thalictrum thalictroides]